MRVEYRNPPIEEALCQLTFAEPVRWTVASPGLIFEQLRDQYPVDPESQEQIQASFEVPPGAETAANLTMNRGPARIVFRDETKTRLVVLNDVLLSVNSLKPYEGWPALRERLQDVMNRVSNVIGEPAISRVSLRYINRIVMKPGPVDTDDYFNLKIHTADGGRAQLGGFIHRVQSILSDEKTKAMSTFATVESENAGQNAFLLDLDFQREFDTPLEMKDALAVADELKEIENAEFEACITDATRELFN